MSRQGTHQTPVKNSAYHSLTHDIIKWQPKRLEAGSGNCLWGIHVGRVIWRLAGSWKERGHGLAVGTLGFDASGQASQEERTRGAVL